MKASLLKSLVPVLFVATQGLLWADDQCPLGNATQTGTYAMTETGTIPGVGPLAVVGLVFYDGQGGGMLISATASVNGTASKLSGLPASFTVNRDCTGSKTIGTGANTKHFDYVISPDGSTITFIETDTGVTASGVAVRLKK